MTVFARVFERGFMTVEDFDVFLRSRADRERWQLIGGQPIMMAPPTLVHQRIAANFQTLMNAALASARQDLFAYATVGVRNLGSPSYAPEPDVSVIPAQATFEHYATSVHVVLEIRSDSNTADLIRRKIDFYKAAPTLQYILIAEQRAPEIDVYSRANEWRPVKLVDIDARVQLPEFGFDVSVGALFAGTPAAQI